MWDRKELKARGKAAYRANRITCIFAAFLLTIAMGAGSGLSVGSNWGNVSKNWNDSNNNSSYNYDIDDIDDLDDIGEDIADDLEDDFGYNNGGSSGGHSLMAPLIAGIVLIVVLIAVVIACALSIFLLNPMLVGLRKFFIDNSGDPSASLSKSNIGLAFSDKYMNVVGAMFTTNLFIALWTCLLIIPGIYKMYQWRLVSFLLSENPDMTGAEAREMSARMMDGSKWASFVLDLSFIGWKILGGFTLGILNLIFTNPYVAATDAELYLTLSGRPSKLTEPAAVIMDDQPEAVFDFDQEGLND